jgi:hypothetical protein
LVSPWKRLPDDASESDSSKVFQAWQAGHCPCHLGELPPQAWQT